MTRLASLLVLLLAPALWADHHFDGTWKLNAAKSKSTGPGWKSRTLTIKTAGDTRHFNSNGVTLDGQTLSGGYEAKFDGKDYPIKGGLSGADAIALKQVTDNNLTFTMKKGGKTMSTGGSVVSADGKVLTITTKGTGADGKPYTSTAVYDKQ